MRNTVEGFRQDYLIHLKLTPTDALVLRWFLSFTNSGNQMFIDYEGERFYWIRYSKVIHDLPILYFKNEVTVGNLFRKLCGQGQPNENEYPLKKHNTYDSKYNKVYFNFRPEVLEIMEGSEMRTPLFDAVDIPTPKKEKDKQKVKANKNVIEILENLKAIKYENKNIFSNHEMPTDETHYNKTFKKFQEMLYDIYEGRFLTKYPLENLKAYFKTQYKYYLQKEKIIACINKCKGNWDKIYFVVKGAAINYSYWHAPDSECRDPDKLPKSINTWLYDSFNSLSMFYVCLLEKPTSLREASADKIYNTLSPKAQNIMLKLYNDNWDGFTYWNKVKDIVKWYRQYAEKLCEKDSNCVWWIGNGLYSFLENYKEWLLSFTNKPNPGNIGIDCKTWDVYLNHKKREHDISINIPSSL